MSKIKMIPNGLRDFFHNVQKVCKIPDLEVRGGKFYRSGRNLSSDEVAGLMMLHLSGKIPGCQSIWWVNDEKKNVLWYYGNSLEDFRSPFGTDVGPFSTQLEAMYSCVKDAQHSHDDGI